MKRVSRAFVLAIAIFSMMVYLSAFASAESSWKDGVFIASGEVAKDGSNYKLILTVADGKVDSVDFGKYSGEVKMKAAFADYVAEDQRDAFKAEIAEIDEYQQQLNSTLDGSKVEKSAKPAEGLAVYDALQALWKVAVKDAGGSAAAGGAASTDAGTATTAAPSDSGTAPVSDNPKTGDSSMVLYYVLAGAALAGMAAFGRKKLTA